MAELAKPASIHWVDGSQEENEALIEQMVAHGTLTRLNQELWPGCYYARSDLRSFSMLNWQNGVWAILPFLYSPVVPVRLRHLVPLCFALALAVSNHFLRSQKRSKYFWLACRIPESPADY